MIRSQRSVPLSALVLALSILAACGGQGEKAPASPAASGSAPVRPAQTLPIPGSLPAGHPPVEGSTSGRGVTWDAPASWVETEPASSMRVAQYRIDGSAGAAECVVYYFGPNQGGDAMANAERWAGQFTQPDGSASIDRMKVSEIEATTGPGKLVEVTGTYDGGMTMTDQPAKPRPGSMLLGGIVPGPDAPWFFKLTGPEATVRAERERFVALLRSVRAES